MSITKELSVKYYQELGSKISCLNDPMVIADTLRGSQLPFKEGTFAVLEAASELFHSGAPVQFVLGGEPCVLDYQVLYSGETIQLKYLDYHKCEAEVSVKTVNEPQRFPVEEIDRLGYSFREGVIALRYLGFDVYRERPNICSIYGVSMTRVGFEGQGLGLGLGLLIDIIIRDVHKRRTLPQEVNQYHSLIQDNAHSQDKNLNRQHWSSNLAHLLGYKQTGYYDEKANYYRTEIYLP